MYQHFSFLPHLMCNLLCSRHHFRNATTAEENNTGRSNMLALVAHGTGYDACCCCCCYRGLFLDCCVVVLAVGVLPTETEIAGRAITQNHHTPSAPRS